VPVEIHQRKTSTQPTVLFLDPQVPHLVEDGDAISCPEQTLHLGSHSRLSRVLPLGVLFRIILELGAPGGHVVRLRRDREESEEFLDGPRK
jgi:hypothetical protein